MEVETISRECIKPSAPTPLHLKHTNSVSKINFAIILLPLGPYTIPLINLSDASDIDHIVSKRLQLLKQSLSETLVRFFHEFQR